MLASKRTGNAARRRAPGNANRGRHLEFELKTTVDDELGVTIAGLLLGAELAVLI